MLREAVLKEAGRARQWQTCGGTGSVIQAGAEEGRQCKEGSADSAVRHDSAEEGRQPKTAQGNADSATDSRCQDTSGPASWSATASTAGWTTSARKAKEREREREN